MSEPSPYLDQEPTGSLLLDRLAACRWIVSFPMSNLAAWRVLQTHGARYVGVSFHHSLSAGSSRREPSPGVERCRAYVETPWLTGTELDGWFKDTEARMVSIRRVADAESAIRLCRTATDPQRGPWTNDPALLAPDTETGTMPLAAPVPRMPERYEGLAGEVIDEPRADWLIDMDTLDVPGGATLHTALTGNAKVADASGSIMQGMNGHNHCLYHVRLREPKKSGWAMGLVRKAHVLPPTIIATDVIRIRPAE